MMLTYTAAGVKGLGVKTRQSNFGLIHVSFLPDYDYLAHLSPIAVLNTNHYYTRNKSLQFSPVNFLLMTGCNQCILPTCVSTLS